MLPLYARALDMPPDFFQDKFPKDRCLNVLRVSHMPPDPLDDNEFNICPHTDGSFMTLLATSDQPGLEILTQSGQWIKAPLIPDAFVVNSGDLLARWSNGRVLSTPHRVANASGTHRYSIPFFLQPTADTVIDCLPTCCGPDNPPKKPPITCGAYAKKFIEASFALGDTIYNDKGELVSTAS
jgi:isopenicillin N synthase-like dioxygenase